MKLRFTMWAAILFVGVTCLAQGPPGQGAIRPSLSESGQIPPVQTPPAETAPPVVIPNTPFESGGTPARTSVPTQVQPANAPPIAPAGPAAVAAAGGESGGRAKKPYVIGAMDILDIRVWNDPKLSGIFDVRPDGVISMNLIGEIRADGMTVAELTKAIVEKLGDLINAPEVNVQVARVNSKRYYIFGEVGRGGEFPLIADTTVLEALSNTGGFREFANPKKIYVLRGSKRLPFNYKDVSHGKHMEQNILLENGDKIFVP